LIIASRQSPARNQSGEKIMTEAPILLQRDGAIARITLNRPDRINALTLRMLGELSAAMTIYAPSS
jgi:1,4-dihydroxy-2-naphthoyl-CoA synthase